MLFLKVKIIFRIHFLREKEGFLFETGAKQTRQRVWRMQRERQCLSLVGKVMNIVTSKNLSLSDVVLSGGSVVAAVKSLCFLGMTFCDNMK